MAQIDRTDCEKVAQRLFKTEPECLNQEISYNDVDFNLS